MLIARARAAFLIGSGDRSIGHTMRAESPAAATVRTPIAQPLPPFLATNTSQ